MSGSIKFYNAGNLDLLTFEEVESSNEDDYVVVYVNGRRVKIVPWKEGPEDNKFYQDMINAICYLTYPTQRHFTPALLHWIIRNR